MIAFHSFATIWSWRSRNVRQSSRREARGRRQPCCGEKPPTWWPATRARPARRRFPGRAAGRPPAPADEPGRRVSEEGVGEGEWVPNQYGGNENLDALNFLRRFNETVFQQHPGVQTIAEESTAWPMVSRPTLVGGLGFGLKWDMG